MKVGDPIEVLVDDGRNIYYGAYNGIGVIASARTFYPSLDLSIQLSLENGEKKPIVRDMALLLHQIKEINPLERKVKPQ